MIEAEIEVELIDGQIYRGFFHITGSSSEDEKDILEFALSKTDLHVWNRTKRMRIVGIRGNNQDKKISKEWFYKKSNN